MFFEILDFNNFGKQTKKITFSFFEKALHLSQNLTTNRLPIYLFFLVKSIIRTKWFITHKILITIINLYFLVILFLIKTHKKYKLLFYG